MPGADKASKGLFGDVGPPAGGAWYVTSKTKRVNADR